MQRPRFHRTCIATRAVPSRSVHRPVGQRGRWIPSVVCVLPGSALVPESPMAVELDVSALGRSLAFYVAALGFTVAVHRPARRFAYLTLDGSVDVMLQGRRGRA